MMWFLDCCMLCLHFYCFKSNDSKILSFHPSTYLTMIFSQQQQPAAWLSTNEETNTSTDTTTASTTVLSSSWPLVDQRTHLQGRVHKSGPSLVACWSPPSLAQITLLSGIYFISTFLPGPGMINVSCWLLCACFSKLMISIHFSFWTKTSTIMTPPLSPPTAAIMTKLVVTSTKKSHTPVMRYATSMKMMFPVKRARHSLQQMPMWEMVMH